MTALNIFVCVKQTPDIRSEIIPNYEASYIETKHLHWSINPEDECAVEQALLFREQLADTSITAIRVGDKQDSEALINALAMGADDAILINTKDKQLDPFMTAKALKGVIENSDKEAGLILCGNESLGDESYQVPQILAQMLGLPCITKAVKCFIDNGILILERQIEGGTTEKHTLNMPAVIACSYGINTPRYAPFPHIQAAYKKPLIELSLADVGINDNDRRLYYSNYRLAPEKKTGKIFYANDKAGIENTIEKIVEIIYSDLDLLPGHTAKK